MSVRSVFEVILIDSLVVQASVGSSATGRRNYRHMVFLIDIGVGNQKKLGKRAGVGAFG